MYVAADPEFVEHPSVANGASDVLIEALGPTDGARAAVGVASLPLGERRGGDDGGGRRRRDADRLILRTRRAGTGGRPSVA